ncbi:MAG: DMT family transporter [Actinobacteria bacterium]|nr:DMT family transporter [Actinomycetota bacterium]
MPHPVHASRRDRRGLVVPALVTGVVAVSFAAIFLKLAEPTHALTRSGLRLLMAAGLLLPAVIRGWRRGRLRPVLGWAAAAGLLYAVHFSAWIWSLDLTSVAASVTLVTASPLLLAVVGVVTGRDRPEGRLWGALALGAVGVALVGGADLSLSSRALAGDGLALVGTAAMAAYLLLARGRGASLEVWSFMGVACAVGGGVVMAVAAVGGVGLRASGGEALLYIFLSALIPQLAGHGLLTWSLRHTTPTVVALALLGEPIGSTLLAWAWLGEAAPPLVLVGCGIVLASLVLALSRGRERGGPAVVGVP